MSEEEKRDGTNGANDGGLAGVGGLVVDIEGGGPLEVGLNAFVDHDEI